MSYIASRVPFPTFDDDTRRHARIIHTLACFCSCQELVADARVCSAVVLSGEIIAIGQNKTKTHPLAKQYGKNADCMTIHAELDALIKASKQLDESELKRSTLYVCRIRMTPKRKILYGIAKPCCGCARAINAFGIRRLVYTNDDSSLTIIKE